MVLWIVCFCFNTSLFLGCLNTLFVLLTALFVVFNCVLICLGLFSAVCVVGYVLASCVCGCLVAAEGCFLFLLGFVGFRLL